MAHLGDRRRPGGLGDAGALVAPILLRRMARRQTGSQIEAARDASLQWVK